MTISKEFSVMLVNARININATFPELAGEPGSTAAVLHTHANAP